MWFIKPSQVAILHSLQGLHHFLKFGGDPQGITDLLDLSVQAAHLARVAESTLALVDSTSSCKNPTTNLFRLMFVDGRILWCSRSALTNGGGYLMARFGHNSLIPPGAEIWDSDGQLIHFIEQEGGLFENYILPSPKQWS